MEYPDYFQLRRLLAIEGIGPVKIRNLLARFEAFEEIFEAPLQSLTQIDGINSSIAKKIVQSSDTLDEVSRTVDTDFKFLENSGTRVLYYLDEDFPQNLKNIYDPPLLLFIRGDISELSKPAIAMVGSRKPTQYGKLISSKIAREIAGLEIGIISGLARGIDTLAHTSALSADGKTYAIMGTGMDLIYPAENKKLAEQILEQGALITEYFPKTLPEPGNFPRRNRIISGLSRAVIVVETGLTGGAMITANLAADQGRDVYAVPGNLGSPQSEGTNQLIKIGSAKLYNTLDDVLSDIGIGKRDKENAKEQQKVLLSLNLFEQKIHSVLSSEPISIDKIATVTGLSVSDCLVNLLSLEFKGIVRQLPGKMFITE